MILPLIPWDSEDILINLFSKKECDRKPCYLVAEEGLKPHMDHIYPITLGGLGTKENMVYVWAKYNQGKSVLTLREFIKKKGLERIRVENNLELLGKKFWSTY